MYKSKIASKTNHLHSYGSLPISKQKLNNKNYKEFYVKGKEDMIESSPASTEQQLESQFQKQMHPNQKIPLPITQTKLTQTHCNLQQIPLVIYLGTNTNNKNSFSRSTSQTKRQDRNQKIVKEINKDYIPQKIRELYLSHNHIKTVKNKLRYFVSLKNLNLSYNLLTDVQQFIQEVMGTYDEIQPSPEYNSVGSGEINMINSFQTFGPRLKQKINRDKFDISLKKDKVPLSLKILSLRMNKFPYGFEDSIIKNVVSLERYEDYFFKQLSDKKMQQSYSNSSKSKNMNEYQDKALIFQLGNKVSEYFIPAMSKLKEVQQQLTIFYESLFDLQGNLAQNDQNRMRKKIYMNLLEVKYEKIVIQLCQYLTNKKNNHRNKQQKYLPKSRLVTLSKLLQYQGLCLQLQQFIQQKQNKINNRFYLGQEIQDETSAKDRNDKHKKMVQRTTQIFTETVRNILTKFANRNNNQLIKTLQSQKSKYKHGHKGMTELANTMGGYFKAQHYKIYESNPGKYLEKIDSKCVQQHPYMDYMKYKIKQKQKKKSNNAEVFTLDGNRQKTKNTIIRHLNQFADHHKQQVNLHHSSDSLDLFDDHNQFENEEGYYQKMPIIIFERNYLQVITQIWEENLRQFIKIYDITCNKLSNMEKSMGKEVNGQKIIKIEIDEQDFNNNNLNKIQNIRYMQDQDQLTDKNADQNDKKMEQFYLDKRKLSIYHQGQQNKQSQINNDKKYEENMKQGQSDDYELTFSFDEDKQNSKTKTNFHNNNEKFQLTKIQQLNKEKKERVKLQTLKQKQGQKQEDMAFKAYEERKTIPKFYNISNQIEKNRKKTYQQKIDNINDLNIKVAVSQRKSYISQKINNLGETINRAKQQQADNIKKQKQSPIQRNNKKRSKSKNQLPLKSIDCENYREDLEKYSIYEINLAYKVFFILKKNRNKQKKKRAKRQLVD